MTERKEMSKSIPWVFMFNSASQAFVTTLLGSYLAIFMTNFLGVSLAMMGSIMMVSRIATWAISLVAGALVQKTNTKWGQFRPYALVAPITVAIGNALAFCNIPGLSVTAQGWVSGFGYVLSAGTYIFIMIMRNGFMTVIAGANMEHRMALTSKSAQGAPIGSIFTALITPVIINYLVDRGMNGYFIVTMVYNVLWIIPSLILFFATKEYDTYRPNLAQTDLSSNVNIVQMYADTLKNGQFLALFIAGLITSCGSMAVMGLNAYYYIYSLNDLNLMGIATSISMAVGLVAASIMPQIAKRIGKKNSAIVSSFIACGVNILVALFTHGNFIIKVALTSAASFGSYILMSWGANLYLDAAEYQLNKTGKDTRQFVMSLQSMISQIGQIVAAPIMAMLLGASGFDEATRTMENPLLMVRIIGFLPAATSLIAAVIYAFFYKITDAQAAEYAMLNQKAAEEKRAAAAAAAATQG